MLYSIVLTHMTREVKVTTEITQQKSIMTEKPQVETVFDNNQTVAATNPKDLAKDKYKSDLSAQSHNSFPHPTIPNYFPKRRTVSQIPFSKEELEGRCSPKSTSPCSDITMVTQLSFVFSFLFIYSTSRLPFLKEISKRWHGYYSLHF